MGIDMTVLDSFAENEAALKAARARVKELAEKKDELMATIIDMFEENGVSSLRCSHGNVVLSRKYSARVLDPVAVRSGMMELGFEDMLSVNSNSLRSFVREFMDEHLAENPEDAVLEIKDLARKALPEALQKAVEMSDYMQVALRK